MILQGKVALVTGGSRGIGRAIVEQFLQQGASVACVSTKPGVFQDELLQVAEQYGGKLQCYYADVGNQEQVNNLVQQVLHDFQQVDILVNNAGIVRDGLLFAMKDEQWSEVLRINLTSVFYFCRPIARHMAQRRCGSIINMSSVIGVIGNGGQANYAAAKAGIIGFSKSLAKELAARKVRVNVIAPGYITTDMTSKLSEKQIEKALQYVPMACAGNSKDVASAALFLASDMSNYITGHTLAVDGGMAM